MAEWRTAPTKHEWDHLHDVWQGDLRVCTATPEDAAQIVADHANAERLAAENARLRDENAYLAAIVAGVINDALASSAPGGSDEGTVGE